MRYVCLRLRLEPDGWHVYAADLPIEFQLEAFPTRRIAVINARNVQILIHEQVGW